MKKTGIVGLVVFFLSVLLLGACSNSAPASGGNRILYVPLDDRPVNYSNVIDLATLGGYELIYPGGEQLDSHRERERWLKNNAPGTEAVVVSVDMLAYGGLVESRKHILDDAEIASGFSLLKNIDAGVPVLAFVSIMRTPMLNTRHTMPDYYAQHGARIHNYGVLQDKINCGEGSPEDEQKLREITAAIPAEHLHDFIQRREKNHRVTGAALELVRDGYIDYLVISSDDTSPYGFSRAEKEKLTALAEEYGIMDKVMFFPGADECGMLLLAAAANKLSDQSPAVFPDYARPSGAGLVQPYEDLPLDENVRRHILAAGARPVASAREADLVLAVNNKAGAAEADAAPGGNSTSPALALRVKSYLEAGKPVAVADVMYANGGDPAFLGELDKAIDLSRLAGYAGWNTAGNTIGMALGQGLMYNQGPGGNTTETQFEEKHRRVLLTRLVEDWGYQAVVRPEIKGQVPAEQQQLFSDRELEGTITRNIEEKLNVFAGERLTDFGTVQVTDVKLPWHRLFDIVFANLKRDH